MDPGVPEKAYWDPKLGWVLREIVVTPEDRTIEFVNAVASASQSMRAMEIATKANPLPIQGLVTRYTYFVDRVWPHHELDLKNQVRWKQLGRYVSINGRIYGIDDLGNILYGVSARELGIPLIIALSGAGFAQTVIQRSPDLSNRWGFYDRIEDTPMIVYGYESVYALP